MTSLLLVGPSYGTNADRNGPWLRKLSPSGSGVPPIYVADDTYDVFVSYSRADGRHAAEIDSVLHKGLKTFFDRRNLATGLPWVRVLEQAIGAPRAVIVLIGLVGSPTPSNINETLPLFGRRAIRRSGLGVLLLGEPLGQVFVLTRS